MKQKEEFFMPMVHEAIDRFLGHLTVEVAKPVFDLLIYRRKHSLTEEVLEEHFEQVIIEEQTYQYYLARMRRELEQLFELTPPYLHKKLRSQVNGLPLALEKAIERKGIISQLKWSNSFSVKKVYRPDGQFELYRIPRKERVLDVVLLKSAYLDEYVAILNSMLFYFKDAISVFADKKSGKNMGQKESAPPVSEYLAPPLLAFMLDRGRFLDTCYKYSLKNIKWSHHNKPVIECVSKEGGKYLWKATLPMLGEFITTLQHKDVQILRPLITKKDLAELFLKFFGLSETYPNPHYLSLKIEPDTPPKLLYFSDMKKPAHSPE